MDCLNVDASSAIRHEWLEAAIRLLRPRFTLPATRCLTMSGSRSASRNIPLIAIASVSAGQTVRHPISTTKCLSRQN